MNEILFTLIIALTLLIIIILSKIFSKQGLIFAALILNISSYIMTFKIIEIFKLNINLGIIAYIAVLSIVYIYLIKYGLNETNKINTVCLYANLTISLMIVIMNYFVPAITETVSINIKGTFETNYKILILFPLTMYLSQYLITKLYIFVSHIQSNIPICIILTHIIVSLLYVIIFNLVAYLKVLSIMDSLYIGVSTYIIGLLVTVINIIFINYFIKSKKVLK